MGTLDERPLRRLESPARLVVRFALSAAALVVLWLAADRWSGLLDVASTNFERPSLGQQLLVAVLGAVGGSLLGLAALLPRPPVRYGVGRALAAGIPPAVFVVVVLMGTSGGAELLPTWALAGLTQFGPQAVIFGPVALGVALTAGFTASGVATAPDA